MFRHRLHTIPDIDQGRIPDNRSGANTMGSHLPKNTTATNPWYFGGANQRFYANPSKIGSKGAFRGTHSGRGLYA